MMDASGPGSPAPVPAPAPEPAPAPAPAPRERVRPVDPRLLRYAAASRRFFVVIAAISVAQTVVIVAFAWLLTRAIVGAVERMSGAELAAILGALALVVIARALLLWVRESVAARAAATVQAQLRAHLIDAVAVLGPEWLATRNSAQLAVTAGHGLQALEAYFGRYLPQLVQTVIATPVIIAVMWWQDWISGLTVLLTLPLIPIFMMLIGWATRAIQKSQWQTLSLLAARFSDTVQGLATLKVYGRQHRAAASIESVTNSYRIETMRVLRVSFLSGFALEFLASIAVAIVAVSIGFRLIDGALALMVGLFVLLLAPEAYLPLRQVGVQFHAAAEGVAATEDIFAVLEAAGDAAPAVSVSDSRPSGDLVVRELCVRRGERALAPVDLVARPRQIVLIEGASGSGKSSVLAALRGVVGYTGTAELGGRSIGELHPASWLAWAGQQPGLVSGRIADNVALGDAAPDAALVSRALALACAGDLDPALELGVQGAGLSGGQAQRVAVARAFYRWLRGRASVIAIDEPSAALDTRTEARLWASVRTLADEGATIVLVSHRESAREIADSVVRIEPVEVSA